MPGLGVCAENAAQANQIVDTTRVYLKQVMTSMNDAPPSFSELTHGLRLLTKPLPLIPAGFACIQTLFPAEDET